MEEGYRHLKIRIHMSNKNMSSSRKGSRVETAVEQPEAHQAAMEELQQRLAGLEENMAGMGAEMGGLSEQLTGLMGNHNTTHESILELGNYLKQRDRSVPENSQPIDPTTDLASCPSTTVLHTATASLLRDLSFSGAQKENVRTFLQKLNGRAELFSLSDTQKAQIFGILVTGLAFSWYQSLDNSTKRDWQRLQDACMEQYGPPAGSMFHVAATLEHTQGRHQSVDSYIAEMVQRFERCDAAENRRVESFVRGLRPEFRVYVMEKDPSTFREAERLAKKIEHLQSQTKDQPPPAAIEAMLAYTPSQTQAVASVASDSDLARQVRELTAELALLKSNKEEKGARAETVDDRRRRTPQSRTTQGRPRCQRCDKVGHYNDACGS